MFTLKYYDAIKEAQKRSKANPPDALEAFDLNDLGADSLQHRIGLWARDRFFRIALFLLRAIRPNLRLGRRLVIITRDKDVREVLDNPEAFEVPYGLEMHELGGADFVLGLEGKKHDDQRRIISSVMLPNDTDRISEWSAKFAKALIRSSAGRIDVMKDFITRVATETCIRYFGLTVDDPDAFAEWTISISALLFADPSGDEKTRRLALNGAARVRAVIDRSIVRQKQLTRPDDQTVLGRLLNLKTPHDEIRAILVGLVTGFIPTNTLAAGKILQQLLRRTDTFAGKILQQLLGRADPFEEATAAARRAGNSSTRSDGRRELQRLLFEAARLNPALAPGQWRYAKKTTTVAAGTWRAITIKEKSVLMVATMSALRDSRRIGNTPDPSGIDQPWPAIELMFGHRTHACLGNYVAMAQITAMFEVLLSQQNLRTRRSAFGFPSAIRWVGPFPRCFDMEFEPAWPASQTMVTICAPLAKDANVKDIRETMQGYGNPAKTASNPTQPTLGDLFDKANFVHFASFSLINLNAGSGRETAAHLLLELSVDGSQDDAIREIAKIAHHYLQPFHATPAGRDGANLEEILREYALDFKTFPWGDIGLNYFGTKEFSVPDIEKQASLAAFSRDVLDYFLRQHVRFGNRAIQALKFVRMFIEQDKLLTNATDKHVSALLERGREFSDYLIIPSRKRLEISKWEERGKSPSITFLKSPSFWYASAPLWLFMLGTGIAIFQASASLWLGITMRVLLASVGAIGATALLASAVFGVFIAVLRYHERHDVPDLRNPKSAEIEKIAAVENPPGYVQNHFMSVSALKPGWFRKLTLALSLWGIQQLIKCSYRPGFVLNMGTIHYARWFRPAGTENLIFLSNYDGSWESYLEDFIMKAHAGQTAAWSNGAGFPQTRDLIKDGAQDGDQFKRWVRLQQVLAQFWYSRFPKLTTDHIRNNALIHDGLARARTDSEARAWLDCFGSMPRPDYAIEADEVQSLVFRGLRTFPNTVCAVFQFLESPEPKSLAQWLDKLVPGSLDPHTGRSIRATDSMEIAFGDRPFTNSPEENTLATFVAFTATGLKKLGMSGPECCDGLGSFQSAFSIGMVNRSRILGDGTRAKDWRWADSDCNQPTQDRRAADAVVLIYGKSIKDCETHLEKHETAMRAIGRLVHKIETKPVWVDASANENEHSENEHLEFEHFGFRDGISQPIIRGTQRSAKGVALERDIVEPGEFILGYRNNQGYYPPAPVVRADSDLADSLPTPAEPPSRFPEFGRKDVAVRDFGRNGTYLVITQLAQDVDGFAKFTLEKAAELSKCYSKLADVAGGAVTADWVAAKLMGRWRDGTPLVERSGTGIDKSLTLRKHSSHENDFSYALDDPQGLLCPFGSHIRRTNPRDSLQPDDPAQQSITNRHRLLRRGRAYEYLPKRDAPEKEKGLLFIALCADLERQFEFIQQTWVNSPSFHGLKDEPDPIVAGSDTKTRMFTIPTQSGPVRINNMESFVSAQAGGYFFLPSRSAIRYLAHLNAGK